MPEFRAGLDLGQVNDSSALIIMEEIEQPKELSRYDVRHVQRWKLGTPYPTIVNDVVTMMMSPPLSANCPLAVDATGVGRPVVDMFHNHPGWNFPLTPVVITGGNAVTFDQGYMHVPKRDLVGAVQVLLQSKRLRFPEPSRLPEVATLMKELGTFQVKITLAANDIYGAWREGQHDDLVLALATCCVVFGTSTVGKPQMSHAHTVNLVIFTGTGEYPSEAMEEAVAALNRWYAEQSALWTDNGASLFQMSASTIYGQRDDGTSRYEYIITVFDTRREDQR